MAMSYERYCDEDISSESITEKLQECRENFFKRQGEKKHT